MKELFEDLLGYLITYIILLFAFIVATSIIWIPLIYINNIKL